jgi:hypothetical protein
MIEKRVKKYWINSQELLKVFGFKETDLLMGIQIFKNERNPLGFQIQGIDLYVEHQNEGGDSTVSKGKNVKKAIKKVAKKGKK